MKNILLLILLIVNYLHADNQIPNPSFEKGGACNPDNQSQIDGALGCDDWENFNTSDWLTDKTGSTCLVGSNFFNGNYDISGGTNGDNTIASLPVLNAYHGDYYAGFGACEGIQVKLKNEVGGISRMIRVSFWFSPRTREDTKIIVYLLEDRADNFTDCSNPGINTEVSFEIEVNSAGMDATHHPGNWYYVEKSIFACPGDPKYKYLAIKGENGAWANTDECCYRSRRYIYVDDFTLEDESFCNHPCAIQNGGCYMTPGANDINFPNATSGSPVNGLYWSVELNNIIGYKFTVFDAGWDGIYDGDPGIYYIEEFDPNGLSYNGGGWVISWTGENTFGNCVPIGAYPIVIEFWNCTNHVVVFGKTISYLGDGCSFITPISTPCFDDEDCNQRVCEQDLFLMQPPQQTLYQASNNITANAQFVVTPNTRVDFTAHNEIVLSDGFQAIDGSEFRARIAPCDIDIRNSINDSIGIDNKVELTDPRRIVSQAAASDTIGIANRNYQTTSRINICSSEEVLEIRVYNTLGQLVFINHTGIVDLGSHPNGIYYYSTYVNHRLAAKGIILKQESH